jgi:hypothetical protein
MKQGSKQQPEVLATCYFFFFFFFLFLVLINKKEGKHCREVGLNCVVSIGVSSSGLKS